MAPWLLLFALLRSLRPIARGRRVIPTLSSHVEPYPKQYGKDMRVADPPILEEVHKAEGFLVLSILEAILDDGSMVSIKTADMTLSFSRDYLLGEFQL